MLNPMYFELAVPDERQADVQVIVGAAHFAGYDLSENDAYAAYREFSREVHGVEWWPEPFTDPKEFNLPQDHNVLFDALSEWLKWE